MMGWLLVCAVPCTVLADFALAGIFADHMVIQRLEPIQLWGTAQPGNEIKVSIGNEKPVVARADRDGKWVAALEAMPASGPVEIKAVCGPETRSIKDVMIGDVWLVSGQSNMVLALQSTTEWPEAKLAGAFPGIRICKLPGNFSFTPADSFSRPTPWAVLDSAKAGYFSGVGYFFARTVQAAAGVTVGVIQASAGGTQVEQWTPMEAVSAVDAASPSFAARDKALARQEADPNAKVGPSEAGASALFNGTIFPLRYAKFRGVLWYQGEANTRSKRDYRPPLTAFIQSWRAFFNQPALPFVIVQLPNFGLPKGDGWMQVREAQRLVARDLDLPLVVTIDIGANETIHPPNKAEVGRRAGLAALQHVYRQEVEGTGPLLMEVHFQDGMALVEFGGFKGDLVCRGDAVKGFELAGADGIFHAAAARIEGRRVVITAPSVHQPAAVRYLWAPAPEAVTLYCSAGLPAVPFLAPETAGQKRAR